LNNPEGQSAGKPGYKKSSNSELNKFLDSSLEENGKLGVESNEQRLLTLSGCFLR
jgi:hypothetical protein